MAVAEAPKTGLLNLEKELTCSICTEVLYQPLTLLDCLHTFCGSCLKEWFSFEATQAKATKSNPFTCPSCRALVRETRPDAKVTTLLEMFVQANPSQGRTEEEKAQLRERYKPGENVLPRLKVKRETREEADDRRMMEEARDLSLRDVGIGGPSSGSYERGVRHRPRGSTDSTRATLGAQETAERNRRREHNGGEEDRRAQARQINHQSSLRSLLSSSDVDSTDMEEEILRQIMEDGILDGIDLSNIDGTQEDELSEKIAEAYRRRHGRQRSRDNRGERSRRTSDREQISPPQERLQRTREGRSSQASDTPAVHSSHPPLSRPHLLEAYPTGAPAGRRRTSSETRRQTSPARLTASSRVAPDTQRQATRSATDISTRAQQRSADEARSRHNEFSGHGRRTTDPDRLRPRRASHGTESQRPQIPRSPDGRQRETSTSSISTNLGPTADSHVAVPAPASPRLISSLEPRPRDGSTQQDADARNRSMPSPRLAATPSTPSSKPAPALPATVQEPPRQLFPEPSIACNRCGKADLQYELHENCSICNDGNYDLCLRCYRLGRGCLHWFGFGHAALQRYERAAPPGGYPLTHPLPHRLRGRRYIRPPPDSRPAPHNNVSYSDPVTRLQSGPFCSNCSTFAPDCFWKCDLCSEGEWGFCNPCVNQGTCCSHPLLPVAQTSYLASHNNDPNPPTLAQRPTSTSFTAAPSTSPALNTPFQQARLAPSLLNEEETTALAISTKCDICTYPIPPSTTRFHCPRCSSGDYDICTTCYYRLVKRGIISPENGPNGWRRCPQGHRMIIVGFEDSMVGQRRVIDKDLVGGHNLKEESTGQGEELSWQEQGQQRRAKTVRNNAAASSTSLVPSSHTDGNAASSPPLLKTYPPNGGAGMHVQALWSYWPADGVSDELGFPKGAEVRECEDINGDWFLGNYCARRGLFPGNYGRVVGGS